MPNSIKSIEERQKRCEDFLRDTFQEEIEIMDSIVCLMNDTCEVIVKQKESIMHVKPHTTYNDWKKCTDLRLLKHKGQTDNIFMLSIISRSARLNTLNGYSSVAFACLRKMIECVTWINAIYQDAKYAHAWVSGKQFPDGKVQEDYILEWLRKQHKISSIRGSHINLKSFQMDLSGKPHNVDDYNYKLVRNNNKALIHAILKIHLNILKWLIVENQSINQPLILIKKIINDYVNIHNQITQLFNLDIKAVMVEIKTPNGTVYFARSKK